MKPCAIVGLGMLTGPQPGITPRLMEAEAARLAIEDAGVDRSVVNGAIQLRPLGGIGTKPAYTDAFPRVLGLPVNCYSSVGRGTPSAWGVLTAMSYLDMGIADYVVAACSFDEVSSTIRARAEGGAPGRRMDRVGHWGMPFGESRAVSLHGMLASRHMHEYGTKPEHFGAVAVQSRQWAHKNPLARFRDRPLTLEDYLNTPYLAYPYRLLDICHWSDGAVAFLMTTEERARDHPHTPVWVRGVGFGEQMAELWWEKQNYTHLAVKTAKEQAFRQAGITLQDIDCAQLYDCFTGEVILQLEDYGWCKKGEGGPFVAEGRIGPGGSIPVNTSGGLLSAYNYTDLTGLSEAVLQLRGDAGERQIPNTEFALVTGHGGEILSPGMCSVHTTLIFGKS